MMNISDNLSWSLNGLEFHAFNGYIIRAFIYTMHYFCMDIIAPVLIVLYKTNKDTALSAYFPWNMVHVFWNHF